MRREILTPRTEPNAAHQAISELDRTRVITQNADGLHQLAGMPHRV